MGSIPTLPKKVSLNSNIFNEDDIKKIFSGPGVKKTPEFEIEFTPENTPPQPKPQPLPQKIQAFPKPTAMPFAPPAPRNMPIMVKPNVRSIRPYSPTRLILKYLGIFVLIFIISYTITNYQALRSKAGYYWTSQYPSNTKKAVSQTFAPTTATAQNRLIIPKINVNAPIIWNVNEQDIINTLQNGVAHYKGTALPGQTGNIVITGHSSYYLWAPGSFKDVFALLGNLNIGDKIYIEYNNANFVYTVSDKSVIRPSNLTVLNQGTDKELTLITCTPVGTNLYRLVIVAKQSK